MSREHGIWYGFDLWLWERRSSPVVWRGLPTFLSIARKLRLSRVSVSLGSHHFAQDILGNLPSLTTIDRERLL
jgi:hypothetical protein